MFTVKVIQPGRVSTSTFCSRGRPSLALDAPISRSRRVAAADRTENFPARFRGLPASKSDMSATTRGQGRRFSRRESELKLRKGGKSKRRYRGTNVKPKRNVEKREKEEDKDDEEEEDEEEEARGGRV